MRRMALVFTLSLLGGIPAAAQTPQVLFPRKIYKLNKSSLLARTSGGAKNSTQGNAQVACPREVAGPSAAGLHATPLLAYAAWAENYGGKVHILFTRSTDGGFTWSTPKEIFSVQVAGSWDFENLVVGATFNQVYIGMATGKWDPVNTTAWPNDVYVLASADEGKTWLGPKLVNTKTGGKGAADVDQLHMVCTYGTAHLAYKLAAIVSGAQNPNDVYYTAVGIQGGKIITIQAEKRLNNPTAPAGSAAVGYLTIDADGPLVACAYTDARVSGSNQGNLYISVSRDMGRNFKEAQLTKYSGTNPRSDSYWEPRVAVSKTNVYLAYGDVYGGAWPNTASLFFSNDMGQTFKGPVILSPGAKGFDVDGPRVAADGNLVCVAWVDDRDGKGNAANMLYCAVDNQGGKGFLTKVTEIRLGTSQVAAQGIDGTFNIVVRGKRIVLMHEVKKATGGGEDIEFNISNDGGKTFVRRAGTKMGALFGGNNDVDDPRVAMTLNGDVIAYWADDRMSANDLYVSGLKLPELTYLGGGKGFTIGHFTAAAENNLALILVTEKGTSPPLNLDGLGYTGFSINFVFGQYTPIFAGFTGAYLAVVKNGAASFPNAPNGLGIFNAVSLGIDPNSLRLTWFTDPVLY